MAAAALVNLAVLQMRRQLVVQIRYLVLLHLLVEAAAAVITATAHLVGLGAVLRLTAGMGQEPLALEPLDRDMLVEIKLGEQMAAEVVALVLLVQTVLFLRHKEPLAV